MDNSDYAALIITYRRYANLEKLVDLCLDAGISRIYISSDGLKDDTDRNSVGEDTSPEGTESSFFFNPSKSLNSL